MSYDLLIPGHAADEFDPTPDIEVARAFDKLLQAVDVRLRCVWVKADAESFENPGRWHIVRFHSNPELTAYWVIQNEDGSYCEPQERHFQRLQEMDTWTGRRTYRDFVDARSAKKKRQASAFEEKRREFREKLTERLDHLYNTQISVPRVPGADVSVHSKGLVAIERKPKELVLPEGVR